MKNVGLQIRRLASKMQYASIGTIEEVNGCSKLLLMLWMFCAEFRTNWLLAHFTTLLYFVSILLRFYVHVGLAFPGPRMYAESHWRYHTFERYYTCKTEVNRVSKLELCAGRAAPPPPTISGRRRRLLL